MRYHIAGMDNRGTDRHPFGKIYLATKPGGEVVGNIGYGAHRENSDPYAVWPTRETPTLGRDHSLVDRAQAMLRKAFPEAGR